MSVGVSLLAAALCAAASEPSPLSLDGAVKLALSRNERARIAADQTQAAQARLDRARAFFFPELSLHGNYTRRAYETVREISGQRVTLQSKDALSATAVGRLTLLDVRAWPLYRSARLERDAARFEQTESNRVL